MGCEPDCEICFKPDRVKPGCVESNERLRASWARLGLVDEIVAVTDADFRSGGARKMNAAVSSRAVQSDSMMAASIHPE